jgi:hypothetical protein
MARTSRIRGALACAVAGAVGTMAMDALWYARARRQGNDQGPLEWEFGEGVQGWDDVSAPGKVGRLALDKVVGGGAPDSWARTTQNVVHWATGIAWGAQYGLVAAGRARRLQRFGPVFGAVVWLSSYVLLPPTGIYQPIWEYDARTLGKDLSAHLVYGRTTAAAFAAITRA